MLAPPRPDTRSRRPSPRHALEPEGRRSDRTTIVLCLLLLLTTGFVAGTTATWSARVRSSGSTFETAYLSSPTNPGAEPYGSETRVSWSNVTGTNDVASDNYNAGYDVRFFDRGQGSTAGAIPSACPTTAASYGTSVGSTTGTPFTDTNLASAPHTNFSDGRWWCYQVRTVFPCCPVSGGWTSLGTNPVTSVRLGNTLASALTEGDADGFLEETEYLEVTFNQKINTSPQPSGTICTDPVGNFIFFGMSGTAAGSCSTGSETFSGIRVATGYDITLTRRYAMSVSWPGCTNPGTEGCLTLRLTVGALTCCGGGNADVGLTTFTYAGTANGTSLDSFVGPRDFCASGASSGTPGVRADPATGRCQITGVADF